MAPDRQGGGGGRIVDADTAERFPRWRQPTVGPHFFVDAAAVRDNIVGLSGDDAHHLSRVLRAHPGDPVSLSDGAGTVWQATVRASDAEQVSLSVAAAVVVPAPRPRLTVIHALPRQRKLDDVVMRLTEIGVDRVVPVTSHRTQVVLAGGKAARAMARWRAVALAAAKQSRRAYLPTVADLGTWTTAFPPEAPGVVFWEESQTPLRQVLARISAPTELVIGIGPEGGLTQEEIQASGLPSASLGPTVLRTETAALVAASAVRYHFGLFR